MCLSHSGNKLMKTSENASLKDQIIIFSCEMFQVKKKFYFIMMMFSTMIWDYLKEQLELQWNQEHSITHMINYQKCE